MHPRDQAYHKLRKSLDSQAIGFPATRSGSEIKILEHIFTPEEAEIVSFMTYTPESAEAIYPRVAHLVASPIELEQLLDRVQKKGGVEVKVRDERKMYNCGPLVVGMYEGQVHRLTTDFIRHFNQYTADRKFGVAFLSPELPQMRTIPVARSIKPEYKVGTFDEVTSLVRQAREPFTIIDCICRKKRSIEGQPCRVTQRSETCLAVGDFARMAQSAGVGRGIPREEALSILEQNQKEGLVLQPSNTETIDFICSCCGCCCGMLGVHKKIPKPLDYWATNFYAVVDAETCKGCKTCEKRCQVGAIAVSEKTTAAVVDLNRCLGCGVCVTACPTQSLSLAKKPVETKPPQTREELYDIILARKKGALGRMTVTAKIIYDAVRTGQTHLLKS